MDSRDLVFYDMVTKKYTVREWVTYYKNVWTRNLAARIIDVFTDTQLKSVDPKQTVEYSSRYIPVKERLEFRKIAVNDAIGIIGAADKLLALTDEDLVAAYSPEALKVAEDMMPKVAVEVEKEPQVGDECDLDNGTGKGVLADMNGSLICVAKEAEAVEVEAVPEAKEEGEKPDESASV